MIENCNECLTITYHIKQMMWWCFKHSFPIGVILSICFIIVLVLNSTNSWSLIIDKIIIISLYIFGFSVSFNSSLIFSRA